MRLSKSSIVSFRQCPKRLWLERHKPEERREERGSIARKKQGDEVGALARTLFDPGSLGRLLDVRRIGADALVEETRYILPERRPIFEAGFATDRTLVLVDVLLPVGTTLWRAIEVKSSASVKDYQLTDAAVQSYTIREAGLDLAAITIAHIDSGWTYRGDGRYEGLLREVDVTEQVAALETDVRQWIDAAREVVAAPSEPAVRMGPQCSDPFECPFTAYCRAQGPQPRHPAAWLPHIRSDDLRIPIESGAWAEMSDVPDTLLNPQQKRVKYCTITGRTYADLAATRRDLAAYGAPFGFMDFEAVQFAIPRWAGTRPYQQIPFQFSFHTLRADGALDHAEFLDLTGDDPSRAFAEALVAAAVTPTIFCYNAAFERQRIKELAERFPDLADALGAISDRTVDLLPIVRKHYYHPSQKGSWSLKAVLPAVAPDLNYANLDEVQAGDQAVEAYIEAIAPTTSADRKAELRQRLSAYCALDTGALVRIHAFLTGG